MTVLTRWIMIRLSPGIGATEPALRARRAVITPITWTQHYFSSKLFVSTDIKFLIKIKQVSIA